MKVGDNDQREHVNADSEKDMIACAKSQRQKWVCPPKKLKQKQKNQSAFADFLILFFYSPLIWPLISHRGRCGKV